MLAVEVEEWKDIPGFEGMYQASSLGRIRSMPRLVGHNFGGKKLLSGRIMALSSLPHGYKVVSLRKDGKTHRARVPRLVLSAFCGMPENGIVACHNDNNPSNNRLENLRWDTYSGNEADKVQAGTSNRGEKNKFAKLNARDVHDIRGRLLSGDSGISIAFDYGVSCSTISAIKTRRSWAHLT